MIKAILIVAVLSAVFGLFLISIARETRNLTLSSDKQVYRSGEEIKLELTFFTENPETVRVDLIGISGRIGTHENFNASKGKNTLRLNYILPKCNICNGITPGNYTVMCSISSGKKSENTTIIVEIKQ